LALEAGGKTKTEGSGFRKCCCLTILHMARGAC